MQNNLMCIILLLTLLIIKAIKFSLMVRDNHPNNLIYKKGKK